MFQPARSRPPISCNENQARERLAEYVYEYLVHNGATTAAESFKNEVLVVKHPNLSANLSVNGPEPGFLHNWWCVFWDLYSAAPERRDKFDPSQEAKAYQELCMSHYMPPGPMMNGMHGNQFSNPAMGPMGPGMPPPNPEGMGMSNYFGPRSAQPGPSGQSNHSSPVPGGVNGPQRYMTAGGTRSGAPTPSNVMSGPGNFPPGQPPQMFLTQEQQVRMGVLQRMQLQQQAPMGMRMNFPPGHLRHPHMRNFIDSQSGTPPFPPQNQMMPNGGIMCSSATSMMSSPGPGGPPVNSMHQPDGSAQDPRFMMMASNMSSQFMNHHDGSGTPTSMQGPSSVSGGINNGPGEGSSGGNGGSQNSQLHNMLNGGNEQTQMEMKQSPSSVQGSSAVNGGTPGSGGGQHTNPGSILASACGPNSAAHGPGSVHSQSGTGSNSGGGMTQQQMTDQSGQMEFHHQNPNQEDHQEISKIKASLMEGFSSFTQQ